MIPLVCIHNSDPSKLQEGMEHGLREALIKNPLIRPIRPDRTRTKRQKDKINKRTKGQKNKEEKKTKKRT